MAYSYAFGDATGAFQNLYVHQRSNIVAAARNVDVLGDFKFLYVFDHDDKLVEVLDFGKAYKWWWTRPSSIRVAVKYGVPPNSTLTHQLRLADRWYRRKYVLA